MAMVTAMIAPNTAKVSHFHSSATAPAANAEPLTPSAAAERTSLFSMDFISGSLAYVVDDLLCHRIELGIGFPRIHESDRPGHDEFGECEQNADVDDTPHLDLEEILVISRTNGQQEIIYGGKNHQTPQEEGLLPMQRLELGIGINRRPIDIWIRHIRSLKTIDKSGHW